MGASTSAPTEAATVAATATATAAATAAAIEVATTTREHYHHKLLSMKMVLSVLIMISEVQKKFHRKD